MNQVYCNLQVFFALPWQLGAMVARVMVMMLFFTVWHVMLIADIRPFLIVLMTWQVCCRERDFYRYMLL